MVLVGGDFSRGCYPGCSFGGCCDFVVLGWTPSGQALATLSGHVQNVNPRSAACENYDRYQQAADVIASRIKAVRVAAITGDWVKAQANELVQEEDMDAIIELDDMKRMAKEVERQAKIKLITGRSAWNQANDQETSWGNRQKGDKDKGKGKGPKGDDKGKGNKDRKGQKAGKGQKKW